MGLWSKFKKVCKSVVSGVSKVISPVKKIAGAAVNAISGGVIGGVLKLGGSALKAIGQKHEDKAAKAVQSAAGGYAEGFPAVTASAFGSSLQSMLPIIAIGAVAFLLLRNK